VPPPTAPGWTINGSAAITGSTLQLTAAQPNQAGTAFWSTPVAAANLTVSYDATVDSGTGADGLALVLADPAGTSPTAIGSKGGALGFGGIPGIAVALDEYNNAVNPSSNFIGVSDGPTATGSESLHWLATSNLAAPIQSATNHVVVQLAGHGLTVWVNGTQVLSTSVNLPNNVLVGFSGGTGSLTNRHAVSNVIVVSGASSTQTGPHPVDGYWLAAADGGIFSFGNATFYGSTGNIRLNQPIVGMAPTPDGGGYWLVASDGGIFSYGNATFYGSTGNIRLNQPIVGMAATPKGGGYWMVASDGGIFNFGNAGFFGSAGNLGIHNIRGMQATTDGAGYLMAGSDGTIYNFGSAPWFADMRTAVPGYHGPIVLGLAVHKAP
jgi:hypothetical protein